MSNVILDLTKLPLETSRFSNGRGSLDGNAYYFRFHWNKETSKWYMSMKALSDSIDVDAKNIGLLPGKNLIPKGYTDILGELWVIDNSGADENPNYDDMGTRWTLEYVPMADV